jgi:starch synthase
MARIVHIAAELHGFHKTGGLGDAVLALANAQRASGHDVTVVIPKTGVTSLSTEPVRAFYIRTRHGTARGEARVVEVRTEQGVRVWLIEREDLFGRAGIYGDRQGPFVDNDFRFCAFSQYALEAVAAEPVPDVVHAHDWHAASALLIMRLLFGWTTPRAIFTLHNAAHQGVSGVELLRYLGVSHLESQLDWLHHDRAINLVKGAVHLCDAWTTVSPRHAWELTTAGGGFGLHEHFHYHRGKLRGILNGATESPRVTGLSPKQRNVQKTAEKTRVEAEFGMRPGVPLFAFVGRLAAQKGADVFFATVPALVAGGVNVLILGLGDEALQAHAQALETRLPGQVRALLCFDTPLSERIFVAADVLVVPSRFEPCGLVQMYAMQAGAIPVVTKTGGLLDSVTPLSQGYREGDGFLADPGDVLTLALAQQDALALVRDGESLERVRTRIMQKDFSWRRAAEAYDSVYGTLQNSAEPGTRG